MINLNGGLMATSRILALETNVNQILSNLSNVGTNGFLEQRLKFEELSKEGELHEQTNFAVAKTLYFDLSKGEAMATQNHRHVMLANQGFFAINTPKGPSFTRDGNFSVENNKLTYNKEFDVLGVDMSPIILTNPQDFKIAQDGTVSCKNEGGYEIVGQLGCFNITPEYVDSYGTYRAQNNQITPAEQGVFLQGYLEKSNVNTVKAITGLTEHSKHFEYLIKMLDNFYNTTLNTVNNLLCVF